MKKKCTNCNKKINEDMVWPNYSICKVCYEIDEFTKYGNNYDAWKIQFEDLWVAAECIKEIRFREIKPATKFN